MPEITACFHFYFTFCRFYSIINTKQVIAMKGKLIKNLTKYNGEPVWVEFENPDACSCANCGACGPSGAEAQLYKSGVYRAEGHFLVSESDAALSFHEYTPRILAIYEWLE